MELAKKTLRLTRKYSASLTTLLDQRNDQNYADQE